MKTSTALMAFSSIFRSVIGSPNVHKLQKERIIVINAGSKQLNM